MADQTALHHPPSQPPPHHHAGPTAHDTILPYPVPVYQIPAGATLSTPLSHTSPPRSYQGSLHSWAGSQHLQSAHSHGSPPSSLRLSTGHGRTYDPRFSTRHSIPRAHVSPTSPPPGRSPSDSSAHDYSETKPASSPIKQEYTDADVYHSTYSEDDLYDLDTQPTRQVVQALLHVSLLAPFLSVALTLYTLLVLLFTLFTFPVRLCVPACPTPRSVATSLFAAPLRLQLRCVFAPTSQAHVSDPEKRRHWPAADPAPRRTSRTTDRLGGLILTHLLAPCAALPIALCAWVVAFFWACSATINDESSHGDGRGLAMTVIDWWIWWLEGRMFR